MDMPDKKKHLLHANYWRETSFLPPLKMILSVFNKETNQNKPKDKNAENQEAPDEKAVTKLIEKLSEKEE